MLVPPEASVVAAVSPELPELARAQEQLEAGDFEEAVKTLQAGLSQPDTTDEQLVELYRLLGLAQLYLGNEEKARDAFEKLLQARPDFELPKTEPPKIRGLYARIKEDIRKRRVRPVTISLRQIGDSPADAPIEVAARIDDLALGAKAKLYYRRAGAQAYSSVDFVRHKASKEEYRSVVPAYELTSEGRAYEMEYYVEVADAAQRRLAGRGDPFNPLRFQVLAPQSGGGQKPMPQGGGWYENPWVWVGVGAVAAGATAGIVVIATSKPTGTLPIRITIREAP
ncbi:MAG: hypothetical protein HYZ28_28960 [Myxococcales bacterium]|nr:hypothetical protein [Myxococcales bacterium]